MLTARGEGRGGASVAHIGSRALLVAVAAGLGLMLLAPPEAWARGQGDDVRVNLFLDTEGLLDSDEYEAAPQPVERSTPPPKVTGEPLRRFERTDSQRPTEEPRWERDSEFGGDSLFGR